MRQLEYGIARINTGVHKRKAEEKAYDIQFGVIVKVFEFVIGIGTLVVGVYLFAANVRQHSTVCPGLYFSWGQALGYCWMA